MSQKLFLIISILVICFSITACDKDNEPKNEDNINSSNSEEGTEEESYDDYRDPSTELQGLQESEEEEEEIAPYDPNFTMGEWNQNVYTNRLFGIKLSLPDGWTHRSFEELSSGFNENIKYVEGNESSLSKLANLQYVHYLIANNADKTGFIIVSSEKCPTNITLEDYANNVVSEIDTSQEISSKVSNITDYSLGGKLFKCFTVKGSVDGQNMNQEYYLIKLDDYVLAITLVNVNEVNSLDELISIS